MREAYPDMLLIAGTVLTKEQADRAVSAGAQAVVSPGFNRKVVDYCVRKGILILPGCSCPSDMEQAIEAGLSAVKFFPAEASGGIKAIQAMAAPYGQLRFMPTGGVNAVNMQEYLKNDKVLACGGSWMVPEKLIQEGRFEEIRQLTKEAVLAVHGFALAHVGINSADEEEARRRRRLLSACLDLSPMKIRPLSFQPPMWRLLRSLIWERKGISPLQFIQWSGRRRSLREWERNFLRTAPCTGRTAESRRYISKKRLADLPSIW